MSKRLSWFFCFVILSTMLGCDLASSFGQPTSTPATGTQIGGGNSGSDQVTATQTPSPSVTPSPSPTSTQTVTPTPTATPTPIVTPSGLGPFTVRQVLSLGGEKISGTVCSVGKPFVVNVVSPKIGFNFVFVPVNAQGGNWNYAYNIASAGETHDAKGSYTIGQPKPDGSLQLTMKGSDHVAFKGFDGKFPVNYSFDLVPTSGAPCPGAP